VFAPKKKVAQFLSAFPQIVLVFDHEEFRISLRCAHFSGVNVIFLEIPFLFSRKIF
jgi:hypothetical protein